MDERPILGRGAGAVKRSPATSYQLPATSYQLPAASRQSPVASRQLPAASGGIGRSRRRPAIEAPLPGADGWPLVTLRRLCGSIP
ncbi:hypothetical protein EBL85_08665 [Marichromatium sp. AB32]|nr:hypothetical protein EBL85_08665 [Marichromatium sp. AB32]